MLPTQVAGLHRLRLLALRASACRACRPRTRARSIVVTFAFPLRLPRPCVILSVIGCERTGGKPTPRFAPQAPMLRDALGYLGGVREAPEGPPAPVLP